MRLFSLLSSLLLCFATSFAPSITRAADKNLGFPQLERALDQDPVATLRELRAGAARWAALSDVERKLGIATALVDLKLDAEAQAAADALAPSFANNVADKATDKAADTGLGSAPAALRVRIRFRLVEARLAYANAKMRQSYTLAKEALTLARGAQMADLEARALDKMSIPQLALHPQQSVASAKEMRKLIEAGRVPDYFQIYANTMEADALPYYKSLDAALKAHQDNAALAAKFKHAFDESAALTQIVSYLLELGKYDESIAQANALLLRFEGAELVAWRALVLESRGFAQFKLGKLPEAAADLAEARRISKPSVGGNSDFNLLAIELDIALARGDSKQALELLTPPRLKAISESEGYDELGLSAAQTLAQNKQFEAAQNLLSKSYQLLLNRVTTNNNEKLSLQTQLLEEARLSREKAELEAQNAQQSAQLQALTIQSSRNQAWLLAALVAVVCAALTSAFVWRERKRFERLANVDQLTRATSRRLTLRTAQQVNAQSATTRRFYSLVLIDVDHFKSINDEFGHAVGDEVLQTLAQAVMKQLPATATFGRMGGEEFLLVLPDTLAEQAVKIANAVRETVKTLRFSALGERRVTLSLGVAASGGGDEQELVRTQKNADDALYRAKAAGRDQVALFA